MAVYLQQVSTIAASKNELRFGVLNISAWSPDVFGSQIGPDTDCHV